jgi:hypothetical protein
VTLNGRPVATRDRVVLRAPLHSTTYRLVATTGARGATASLRLVVDGHTPDQHAFVVTTPEIATFAVLRSKGQLEAIWRVRDAVHVWLQGRLVSSSGAARVPAGATWLRLVASNDVGSRQRLLHLAPPATPRPRPTATPTAPPTATPVPPPTATPTARPTATPVPPPTATPTARPATPTPRPTRTPTPVSVTVGTTRPPALSRRPAVPTPRPSATPTPVSVTIGSAAPRGAAVMPTPTAVTVTWP